MLALGYGAVLGISGAALQTLFANPARVADITGSSGGAALGAVFAAYWLGLSQPLALAASGAIGAGSALALLLFPCGSPGRASVTLACGLGGIARGWRRNQFASRPRPSPFAFYDSFDWLMGNFTDRSLGQAAAALIPATVAGILLLARREALDMLVLGEDVVASLGLRPRRLAIEVIAYSAIAVGACVSCAVRSVSSD